MKFQDGEFPKSTRLITVRNSKQSILLIKSEQNIRSRQNINLNLRRDVKDFQN